MKKKKLVFAGLDVANKPGKWARAFRDEGYQTHSLVFSPTKIGSLADESILKSDDEFNNIGKILKIKMYAKYLFKLFKLAFKYDVFFLIWPTAFVDVIMLRLLGKKVYVVTCGDDIRDYELLEIVNVYFKKEEFPYYYGRKKLRKNRRSVFLWQLLANKIIVWRELNLYFYKNKKKIIDFVGHHFYKKTSVYSPKYSENREIKIVHAPSNKGAKGTKYISAAIEKLKNEGYEFTYIELTNVPNTVVQQNLMEADIAIDQVIAGDIGSFSFEAMNNGCMVIAYVLEYVLNRYALPVYNTNKNQVYENLKYILDHKNLIFDYQKKALDFFNEYCEEKTAIHELITKLKL